MNVLKFFSKKDKYIKVLRKPNEFMEIKAVMPQRTKSEQIVEQVIKNAKKTPEGVSWDERDINVKRFIFACSLR